MPVDPVAQHGFTGGADAYERGRPSYPPEAVTFLATTLGLGPGRRVLDLAAGTGKMTVLLAATGASVIAVEPVAAMRDRLQIALPGAAVLDGTAEAIPLPDGDVDAVVVAQAFHWFDHGVALAEIARVLTPGGGLSLVWNSRDDRVPWVGRMSTVMHWNRGDIPTYDAGDEDWDAVVAAAAAFTPLQRREFAYEQLVDEATLIDRVTSVSYIAAMDPAGRQRIVADVREIVAGFPTRFVLPYRTFVHWCHRSSSPPS
jgi:SAM-dependent methyltransferase